MWKIIGSVVGKIGMGLIAYGVVEMYGAYNYYKGRSDRNKEIDRKIHNMYEEGYRVFKHVEKEEA